MTTFSVTVLGANDEAITESVDAATVQGGGEWIFFNTTVNLAPAGVVAAYSARRVISIKRTA